jgi:peptidoglycan/xylan/chitin deacetylase (PgdA/CDA1 family)
MLLTFDDGYKDNFDLALPILKKYDASAIFF